MNKEINIFVEVQDEKTKEQFDLTMEQDFVVKGALMPDAHGGYTVPIGAVIACKDVIVPAYVGYDIGCGMCATRISTTKQEIIDNKDAIFDKIYEVVPVGRHNNDRNQQHNLDPSQLTEVGEKIFNKKNGNKSIGSLGGGNHFIEIGYEEAGGIWIVIHSGSRGFGHGIAYNYMALAANSEKPKEGHFPLDVNSQAGKDYINDLGFGLEFALENRKLLIKKVIAAIKQCGLDCNTDGMIINRNHNHAVLEDGLWIHRKGATHADKDMMGVIPGNMRDGSFIVKGKGNPKSMCSSSHGAGRVMGRREADRRLNLQDFKDTMTEVKAKVDSDTLDESPMAYKDIFAVMEAQKDLVEVIAHIKPLINIKG